MLHAAAASVPKHPIPFGDGFWILRANHRAFRELEDIDARLHGRRRSFSAILGNPDGSLSHYQDLLWSMSATHRDRLKDPVVFQEWLDCLPQGDAWESLVTKALDMCAEFWPKGNDPEPEPEPERDPNDPSEEDAEGNEPPAPSEPEQTGASDSISPQ